MPSISTTEYFKHGLPIGVAMLLEQIAGALITAASLALCLWIYDTPFNGQYQVLLIVAVLLALILLRGGGIAGIRVGNGFWSTTANVAS